MKMQDWINNARAQGATDDQITQVISQSAPEHVSDVKNYLQSNPQQSGDWNSLVQQAIPIANHYGINPAVMVGQMALESGRGSSNFAKTRNNLFGYQAYDSNPNMAKSYQTPQQSMMDYAQLITGDPRYRGAAGLYNDPIGQLTAIKNAGYATDPDYIQKITSLPEFKQLASQYSQ